MRALCVLLAIGTVTAQTPLEFDVVSIKRNVANQVMPGPTGGVAAGQYWLSNVSAGTLIFRGYPPDTTPPEILNLPGWALSERYDVLAKGKPRATTGEQEQMWRALLADRLKLQAHYEIRAQRGYRLVLARADRRLGSQLRPSTLDCTGPQPDIGPNSARGAGGVEAFALQRCGFMTGGASGGVMVLSGGTTMIELSRALSGFVMRPVLDRTGLDGHYAVSVGFALETTRTLAAEPSAASELPSVFTAIEEQLGLKLETATVDVQILAIDRIERPTEN